MSDGGTMTRVAAIQKRLEAVTPGPWELSFDQQQCRLVAPTDPEISCWTFCVRPWVPGDWDECDLNDQRFIASAPADIAYLLRLVEMAAAMQEPVYPTTNAYRCLACRAPSAYLPLTHAPDCPYAVFRAAYEEVQP